jgi:hypothetical protein
MNWEAIGAIGEILGAITVGLTLLYLAVQVKYAREATIDANRLNRANGIQSMLLALCTNEDLRGSVILAQGSSAYYDGLAKNLASVVSKQRSLTRTQLIGFGSIGANLPRAPVMQISRSLHI